MIVTCPECQSRYHVDAESLGEVRQVRCISCGNSWMQTAGMTADIAYSSHPSVPFALKSPFRYFSLPRLIPLKLWVLGLSLGVLFISGSFLMRYQAEPMGQLWNNINYFLTLLSQQTATPQEVFKIKHLRTEVLMPHPPEKEIRMSGSITNTSAEVQALPVLKIHFWGEDLAAAASPAKRSESVLLETRQHLLPQSHLLPGEVLSFEVTFPAHHPNLTATSVSF